MKGSVVITAFGMVAVLWSAPAAAASFSPLNTRFTATGEIGLATGSAGFACTAVLKGKTGKKGHAKITSMVLSGSDPHCAGTSATGLPWKAKPASTVGAKISNVGFSGGGLGACGPGAAGVQVNGSGTWSFDDLLPPNCIFSGSLSTSPPITIVP
jgi:hypothetical protein